MSAGGRRAPLPSTSCLGLADSPAGSAWRGGESSPLPIPSVGPPAVGQRVSERAQGSLPSLNSVATQPGATTSSRGDSCGKGVWLGGVSGSPKAPPSSRRRRGGHTSSASQHVGTVTTSSLDSRGRLRSSAHLRVCRGETYTTRAGHTLAAGGLASGGRLAGVTHTGPPPGAVGENPCGRGW